MIVTLKLMRGMKDDPASELEPTITVSVEVLEYATEHNEDTQKALTELRHSLESWVNTLAPGVDIAWDDQDYCFHYLWNW